MMADIPVLLPRTRAQTLSQQRRWAERTHRAQLVHLRDYHVPPVPSCDWQTTPDPIPGHAHGPHLTPGELARQLKTGAWVYAHSYHLGAGWCHVWAKRVPGGTVVKLSAGAIRFIPTVRRSTGSVWTNVTPCWIPIWSDTLWQALRPKYHHRSTRFYPTPDAEAFLVRVDAEEIPVILTRPDFVRVTPY